MTRTRSQVRALYCPPFFTLRASNGTVIKEYNFIHRIFSRKGRIGDTLVGVTMDYIVTILGASVVAIMDGIFLGGNSLILIFIIILTANTLLIEQISRLKNSLQVGK